MVNLTGSPDQLFSLYTRRLSEAAFTIWPGYAPFCFRLFLRGTGTLCASRAGRVDGHVSLIRAVRRFPRRRPARVWRGGGRACRDSPARGVTGSSPGMLSHLSPLKHRPGRSPERCKGTVGASPPVPLRQGRGRGTRAPGQSSLNIVGHVACLDEWVTPNRPRTTFPRGRLARQRGQPSVPRMALREVVWDYQPSGPTGPSAGSANGAMFGSPRGWLVNLWN